MRRASSSATSRRGCPAEHGCSTWPAAREQRLADLLSRHAGEFAFLFNASEGLFVAANGIDWRPGDNAVTALTEFPSVRIISGAMAATSRSAPSARRW